MTPLLTHSPLESWKSMTVKDLKKVAAKRHLDTSGLKADVLAQLSASDLGLSPTKEFLDRAKRLWFLTVGELREIANNYTIPDGIHYQLVGDILQAEFDDGMPLSSSGQQQVTQQSSGGMRSGTRTVPRPTGITKGATLSDSQQRDLDMLMEDMGIARDPQHPGGPSKSKATTRSNKGKGKEAERLAKTPIARSTQAINSKSKGRSSTGTVHQSRAARERQTPTKDPQTTQRQPQPPILLATSRFSQSLAQVSAAWIGVDNAILKENRQQGRISKAKTQAAATKGRNVQIQELAMAVRESLGDLHDFVEELLVVINGASEEDEGDRAHEEGSGAEGSGEEGSGEEGHSDNDVGLEDSDDYVVTEGSGEL